MTASFGNTQQEGWILLKGESPTVRVAPLVINVGKRSLTNSLVGFLKHSDHWLSSVYPWLESRQGKLPAKVRMLDSSVV